MTDLLGWFCVAAAMFAVWFAATLVRGKRWGYAFLALCLAVVLFLDTPPYYMLFGEMQP
jgi:hypothetical protein